MDREKGEEEKTVETKETRHEQEEKCKMIFWNVAGFLKKDQEFGNI